MTSIIEPPRSAEARDSPSTQRTASMMFDLPQPFAGTHHAHQITGREHGRRIDEGLETGELEFGETHWNSEKAEKTGLQALAQHACCTAT